MKSLAILGATGSAVAGRSESADSVRSRVCGISWRRDRSRDKVCRGDV